MAFVTPVRHVFFRLDPCSPGSTVRLLRWLGEIGYEWPNGLSALNARQAALLYRWPVSYCPVASWYGYLKVTRYPSGVRRLSWLSEFAPDVTPCWSAAEFLAQLALARPMLDYLEGTIDRIDPALLTPTPAPPVDPYLQHCHTQGVALAKQKRTDEMQRALLDFMRTEKSLEEDGAWDVGFGYLAADGLTIPERERIERERWLREPTACKEHGTRGCMCPRKGALR